MVKDMKRKRPRDLQCRPYGLSPDSSFVVHLSILDLIVAGLGAFVAGGVNALARASRLLEMLRAGHFDQRRFDSNRHPGDSESFRTPVPIERVK